MPTPARLVVPGFPKLPTLAELPACGGREESLGTPAAQPDVSPERGIAVPDGCMGAEGEKVRKVARRGSSPRFLRRGDAPPRREQGGGQGGEGTLHLKPRGNPPPSEGNGEHQLSLVNAPQGAGHTSMRLVFTLLVTSSRTIKSPTSMVLWWRAACTSCACSCE